MSHILIVDDHEQNIYLLQFALQNAGHRISIARNGNEALKLARSDSPELIVSDILMPVMDGFQLCREWRKDPVLQSIPFIFYTATYTDPKDEKFALDLGADRFVIKPQEPEALLKIVNEVLDAHAAGKLKVRSPDSYEVIVLRQYNERLVHKLEKKLSDLEADKELLEKSGKLLFQTFERITDAFVALDKDWRYTYMNKKAGEIFNRDPQKMTGKHIWTEFPEGIDQTFYKAYHRAMTEQQYIHVEEYYPPYDLWFENHVYPSPDGLSIFFRDVTKRKKSAENLREAHQRLKQHLNNTPLAVIEWDKNLIIQKWSPLAENIFGWREAEVVNKHFNEFNLVFEDDAGSVGFIAQELLTGAVDQNKIINRNNTKSGKVIYCQWFNSLLKDEKGNVNSILSLIQDITEGKKAELLLSGEKKVLEMIAFEKPLKEILNTVALNYESYSDNALCSILLLDAEGTHVRHGAGPSLPDAYNKGFDGEPIGPVAGSCGTAAYRKERVIVSDIANDPLWVNYRDFALSFGLKACWSTPILNNDGKVYGTFAIYYRECRTPEEADLKLIDRAANQVQIVLERYYNEALLKESEEKFRTLVQQAADAIFIVDQKGNYLDANESASLITGYSIDELKKMNGRDIAEPEDLKKNPIKLEEIKSGQTVYVERIIKRKDNTLLQVDVKARLMDNGKVIVILRDITERKNAEEALKESNLSLSEAQRIAKIGNWTYYMNGDLRWSDNMYQLYGLPAKITDVTPDFFFELVHPDDREKMHKWREAILAGETPGEYEYRSILPDGSIHYYRGSGEIKYDTNNNPVYMQGIVQDITERKKAEEVIKNTTEQLRQLTAHLQNIREEERKRIGREIHDELGQQLTAIKMDVAWIDKKIPDETPGIKNKIKNILTLLDGSNQSVRKILSELRPHILEDHGLLAALQLQASQFTENTGVPVQFHCDETEISLPAEMVICLFRVFQESLTNIARYAEATKVLTSVSINKDYITLTVKDNGKGFDTSVVQSKKTFGIIGMRERVFSLNGKFELVSSKGKGTKIEVSLPYKT